MSFEVFYCNRDSEQHLRDAIKCYPMFQLQSLEELQNNLFIVTPTNSLCEYIKGRCQQWNCGFGVRVLTLSQFAYEIINKNKQRPFQRSAVFSWVIRQAIQSLTKESSGSEFFDYLAELERNEDEEDGYSALEESVRELFVAGFQPQLREAYLDSIYSDSSELTSTEKMETGIIIKVASIVYQLMETQILEKSGGFGLQEAIYVQAERCLSNAEVVLPKHRGLIVYGLHDATQVVTSFLERAHSVFGTDKCLLYFHKVLDPIYETSKGSPCGDISNQIIDEFFDRRFLSGERKATEHPLPAQFPFSIVSFSKSIGRQAELRNSLEQIYALHQKGVAWEDCVIVARDLANYTLYLRWEAERLGIPISIESNVFVSTPASRMLRGLMKLLPAGGNASIQSVLSILEIYDQGTEQECLYSLDDIRSFCRQEGLSTLQETISRLQLSMREKGYALNICNSIAEEQKEGEFSLRTKARPRILESRFLKKVHDRLSHIVEKVDQIRQTEDVFSIHQGIRAIVDHFLRWSAKSEARSILEFTLKRLENRLQLRRLEYKDHLMILGRELRERGKVLLDQKGAGVRLFSAPDAVAMNFEYLFLIGLNREEFPQSSKEDPLLDKRVRQVVKELLPGLPLRERKYLVERHLFHWLVSSARKVSLSWLQIDDRGSEVAASPLVRRLIWPNKNKQDEGILTIPTLYSHRQNIHQLPCFDRAIVEGIYGSRHRYKSCLAELIDWATFDVPMKKWGISRYSLVQTIAGSIDELYPDLSSKKGRRTMYRLGPYSGLTGISSGFPALETEVFVTHFEGMNSCPWKSFLIRKLRLPDRNNPNQFASLQANDVGSIVHNILEDIVCSHFSEEEQFETLVEQMQLPPRDILWPDQETLRDMVATRVTEHLHGLGIYLMGVHSALQRRALEFLAVVRQDEFPNGVLEGCVGAEIIGESRFSVQQSQGETGRKYSVQLVADDPKGSLFDIRAGKKVVVQSRFKGDRIDKKMIGGEETLHLVDYKTGKPLSTAKTENTRRRDMIKALGKGQKLQIPIYATCQQGKGKRLPTRGSLFYLRGDVQQRIFGMNDQELSGFFVQEDRNVLERLVELIVAVLCARTIGVYFPRLVKSILKDPQQQVLQDSHFMSNEFCSYCDVKEACRIGDSGYRRRLIKSAEESISETSENEKMDSCQDIFQHLWRLGR